MNNVMKFNDFLNETQNNAKAIASMDVLLFDSLDNKSTYQMLLMHKMTPKGNVIFFKESHFGSWNGGGQPYDLSTMQNKPKRLFPILGGGDMTFEDAKDFKDFMKRLRKNPKNVIIELYENVDEVDISKEIYNWMRTGVRRIKSVDFKIFR